MNEVRIKLVEKQSILSDKPVETREEAIDLCLKEISDLSQEAVIAINFDWSLKPINFCVVALGTPQRTICRPADFWKSAILSNARYTICAHNHPFPGDLTPSKADLEISKDLAISGYHLGIMLWDFLITQGETYMSFQDGFPEHINIEKITDLNIRKNYNVKEVASILQVNEGTVRGFIRNKKLSADMISRREGYIINNRAIFDFINRHPQYRA